MTLAKWVIAYLFDCIHRQTTWPQRSRSGIDYVCCLNCGREFPYSTRLMRIVSKEEQLKDRGRYSGADLGSVRSAPIARSNTHVSIDTFAQ